MAKTLKKVEMEKAYTCFQGSPGAYPPPTPLENLWDLGLLEYISSILEQKLEFLNRTQTSLNFGFFIEWQQMNNFF